MGMKHTGKMGGRSPSVLPRVPAKNYKRYLQGNERAMLKESAVWEATYNGMNGCEIYRYFIRPVP